MSSHATNTPGGGDRMEAASLSATPAQPANVDSPKMKRKERPPSSMSQPDETECSHDEDVDPEALVAAETRLVNLLKLVIFVLLLVVTVLVSIGVYKLTENDETSRFHDHVQLYSLRIKDSFHEAILSRLAALSAMSTSITSCALTSNQSFPFVTVPHFEVLGSELRAQSDSFIVHYMPLINDSIREDWEKYALENRHQIGEAFLSDMELRKRQDEDLDFDQGRRLQQEQRQQEEENSQPEQLRNETILGDGSGFHPKIFSNGALVPRGDEPEGSGPFLPLWQRSPVSGAKQRLLNLNFAQSLAFQGVLPALLENKAAIINQMTLPIPTGFQFMAQNLAISQFRNEDFELLADDAVSFIAYPVMSSFGSDTTMAGVLANNVLWRLVFSRVLPEGAGSFICVLEDSFNHTVSYRLSGHSAEYLGAGDGFHGGKYEELVTSTDTEETASQLEDPTQRSYMSVPLNTEYGKYSLRIYPTKETEDLFLTDKPWEHLLIVVAVSLFISAVFVTFVYYVERRQRILIQRVVRSAEKVASAERDLNEYLAHEIRNPLSSALVAHSFLKATLNESQDASDSDISATIQGDSKIIDSSLHFIDDFLKNMLLMYRASANKVDVGLIPTNLLEDIFEPVGDILTPWNSEDVQVLVECPQELRVNTDPLRIKQVLLNLGRNSSKFVVAGFIRLKASVVEGMVELCVEDSGPGVPLEQRSLLFQKYHTSLEVVTQGNGIGLNLCKNLVSLLNGDIFLDESYDSGIAGSPGSRFVVKLNVAPLPTTKEATNLESFTDTGASLVSLPDSLPPSLPDVLSVLFVDDDKTLRKLFVRSIKRVCPNWKVSSAPNGEAALKLLEDMSQRDDPEEGNVHPSFDLIFVDQFMASSNERSLLGTETVPAMRRLGVHNRICGLSANDMEKDFLLAGADSFMLKPLPFEKKVLENELLRILGH